MYITTTDLWWNCCQGPVQHSFPEGILYPPCSVWGTGLKNTWRPLGLSGLQILFTTQPHFPLGFWEGHMLSSLRQRKRRLGCMVFLQWLLIQLTMCTGCASNSFCLKMNPTAFWVRGCSWTQQGSSWNFMMPTLLVCLRSHKSSDGQTLWKAVG